jgi:hypothetical protein
MRKTLKALRERKKNRVDLRIPEKAVKKPKTIQYVSHPLASYWSLVLKA